MFMNVPGSTMRRVMTLCPPVRTVRLEPPMILRTGPRNRSDSGTSLIELILVLMILAVMAAITAPRLAGFSEGRKYAGEWNRLTALLRYARSEAVSRAVPVQIQFDTENRTYKIADTGYGLKTPPDLLVEHALPRRLLFEFPDAVEREDRSTAIVFLPDGTVDGDSPKEIRLVEDNGMFFRMLEQDPVLGYVIPREKHDESVQTTEAQHQ